MSCSPVAGRTDPEAELVEGVADASAVPAANCGEVEADDTAAVRLRRSGTSFAWSDCCIAVAPGNPAAVKLADNMRREPEWEHSAPAEANWLYRADSARRCRRTMLLRHNDLWARLGEQSSDAGWGRELERGTGAREGFEGNSGQSSCSRVAALEAERDRPAARPVLAVLALWRDTGLKMALAAAMAGDMPVRIPVEGPASARRRFSARPLPAEPAAMPRRHSRTSVEDVVRAAEEVAIEVIASPMALRLVRPRNGDENDGADVIERVPVSAVVGVCFRWRKRRGTRRTEAG
jgi:hypothetical protein